MDDNNNFIIFECENNIDTIDKFLEYLNFLEETIPDKYIISFEKVEVINVKCKKQKFVRKQINSVWKIKYGNAKYEKIKANWQKFWRAIKDFNWIMLLNFLVCAACLILALIIVPISLFTCKN